MDPQEFDRQLGQALDNALAALTAIRDITQATHRGQERAYTALSQIDQIAREALR